MLQKCPGLNYPEEFFAILSNIANEMDAEEYIISNGESLQDW